MTNAFMQLDENQLHEGILGIHNTTYERFLLNLVKRSQSRILSALVFHR
jgi:hypothetical protein